MSTEAPNQTSARWYRIHAAPKDIVADAERRVLDVIKQYTLRSGAQLSQLTGLGPAILYPALFRLEKAGVVESEWEDMKPPRRRRYRLAGAKS